MDKQQQTKESPAVGSQTMPSARGGNVPKGMAASDALRLLKIIFLKPEFYRMYTRARQQEMEAAAAQEEKDGDTVNSLDHLNDDSARAPPSFWQSQELLDTFGNDEANLHVHICDRDGHWPNTSVCSTKQVEPKDLRSCFQDVLLHSASASSRTLSDAGPTTVPVGNEKAVVDDKPHDQVKVSPPSSKAAPWEEIPILPPSPGPKNVLVVSCCMHARTHACAGKMIAQRCLTLL